MAKKPFKLILKYLPHYIGSILTCFLLGITAMTFMWLKNYGDFATTSFVLQAKADCINKAEDDLHRHENWESGQLKDLNDKVDRIITFLIEKK